MNISKQDMERMGQVPMFARKDPVGSLDELLLKATQSGSIIIHLSLSTPRTSRGTRRWDGKITASAYTSTYDSRFVYQDSVSDAFESTHLVYVMSHCDKYISPLKDTIREKAPNLEIWTRYSDN